MRRWMTGTAVGLVLAMVPATASATTHVVWAGGETSFQKAMGNVGYGEAQAFFPSAVMIHVGDSVVWQNMAINFHSIDLLPKGGSPVPLIVPSGKIVTGLDDFAGSPFWFDGKVPELGFNPALFGPSGGKKFNGSARVDSGLPTAPKSFKVTFTKAGTFNYVCDVHPGMGGTVIVKGKSAKLPKQSAVNKAVKATEQADLKLAKNLAKTTITGDNVSLGVASGKVEVLRMFQGVTHVAVGTTVKFAMPVGSTETHTATFGPISYLKPLAQSFAGPAPDARAVYPSSPPQYGPITLNSSSHGNGFANVGALADYTGSQLPAFGEITFTQAGTYNFACLIHPFMLGRIVVS